MIALFAALLAVSLTSYDIDEFFTFPDWMSGYVDVDKSCTPGSDPASGTNGWYVQEFTNGYARACWKIYQANSPEYPIEDFDQPTYNNGAWIQKRAPTSMDPPAELFDSVQLYPFPIIAGEDADELTWYQLYFKDGQMFFNYEFKADRILAPTNLPSGKFVPRAVRAIPAIKSGVISSFAGMLERQYYSMQGQTNGWEQGNIWPRINKKIFRFAPEQTVTTNTVRNIFWDAETSFGRFTEADIEWRDGARGYWNLNGLGRQAANRLGVKLNMLHPDFIYGDGSEKTLNYNGQLEYLVLTNVCLTNFSFTATRSDYVTTNKVYGSSYEYDYIPKSRTIESRRFDDYENIKRLGEFMIENLSSSGKGKIMSERWSTNIVVTVATNGGSVVATTNYYPELTWFGGGEDDNLIFWSSTDSKVFYGDKIVPNFSGGWHRNPTHLSSWWSECCQTFNSMEFDDVWHPYEYSEDKDTMPTVKLMQDVDLSVDMKDPPAGVYDATKCAPSCVSKMKNLIETNFPHADGWAITNDTRRLMSDRLCCINQTLSLMDRTYNLPKITYPTTCTNVEYNAKCYFTGSAIPRGVASVGSYIDVSLDIDDFSWNEFRVTNTVESSSQVSCLTDRLVYRITQTGTGIKLNMDESGLEYINTSDDLVIRAVENLGQEIQDGDYIIDLYVESPWIYDGELGLVLDVDVYWERPSSGSEAFGFSSVPYDIGEISNIGATYKYIRGYNYIHPVTLPKLGKTQPGWQGDIKSTSKYGCMFSARDTKGYVYPTTVTSINETSNVGYLSSSGEYSQRSDLTDAIMAIYNVFHDLFVLRYGKDPDDVTTVLPIDVDDAMEVRDSIEFLSCKVTYAGEWWTRAYVSVFDGDIQIISVESHNNNTGETVDDYATIAIPSLVYDFTNDPPGQGERDGLSLDAKLGIITRTDWDWNTLKRGDD